MDDFLWVEKYRPKTIDETILPKNLKPLFKGYVQQKSIPNLILSGRPGTGKTTVARAMINEIGSTYLMINASLEGTKDTLRTDITDFCSSMSFNGTRKYVILDEADALTHHIQPALRTFMEEFSSNVGFILTCNYKEKIIEALQSRCSTVEFKIYKEDVLDLSKQMFERLMLILDKENVKYDKEALVGVIKKHFPDFRKIINEVQKYSVQGHIDTGILVDFEQVRIKRLMELMKEKNFTEIRKWVRDSDYDDQLTYRKIYDMCDTYFDTTQIPRLVQILGDYMRDSVICPDKELNMLACFVHIMSELKFK